MITKLVPFPYRPATLYVYDCALNLPPSMTISEKNPHDPDDEPTLHEAWTDGAEAAQNGNGVGAVEDRYDNQDAVVACLDGYRHVSANR